MHAYVACNNPYIMFLNSTQVIGEKFLDTQLGLPARACLEQRWLSSSHFEPYDGWRHDESGPAENCTHTLTSQRSCFKTWLLLPPLPFPRLYCSNTLSDTDGHFNLMLCFGQRQPAEIWLLVLLLHADLVYSTQNPPTYVVLPVLECRFLP